MAYCYNKAIKIKKIKEGLTSKNIVACSFGKDSTAMCDRMLRLNQEARDNNLEEIKKLIEILIKKGDIYEARKGEYRGVIK